MIHLLAGSTLEGPFWVVLALLHVGAYGALTVAAALGGLSLRHGASAAAPQTATLRWLRAGFLLLTAGQIAHSTWTTFAWGEFWTWDPAKNLGLLVWLAYAAVLHMHHVPDLRGKKTILASLGAWALLILALLCVNLLPDHGSVSPSKGTLSHHSPASHPGS